MRPHAYRELLEKYGVEAIVSAVVASVGTEGFTSSVKEWLDDFTESCLENCSA